MAMPVHSSPTHLIRPHQHIRWNRQADLLGRYQIDDELEPHRLLDGQVGWLSPLAVLSIATRQI